MNKLHLLLLSLVAAFCFSAATPAHADDLPEKYDILSAGSGTQGTYLVKVYVYSRTGKVADTDLKYAAVHGVLFRGFSGTQGNPSQRPLCGSPAVEEQKADFFNGFFGKDKTYLQYAAVVPASYERVKMSKKGYKVGAIVQVEKDALRKDLEQAGVIRGLNSFF